MEIITSKANAKIVETKKLLEKKYRDKTGLFLIETKKVIFEAMGSGLKLKRLFVLQEKNDFDDEILNEFCQKGFDVEKVEIVNVSKSVFNEISCLVSSDGYIAVFEKMVQQKSYENGNFLILDNLQNPDNMGAIMRTALASNFKQIYTINCVDEYSSKVIRASMGNQFKLKITHIEYDDISNLFLGAKLYTASMEGENIFDRKNFDNSIGVVIGNEGNGVSDKLKKQISNTISIPMKNGVESLNASVSASIIMYYISQNQKN